MKKCYLTEVDKNYSADEDLVLGLWCFKDIADARRAKCIEAYEGEDLNALHKQLYELGIHLLIEDADLLEGVEREIFLLKNQCDYFYFVFFGFYLFRLIKKTLNMYPMQDVAFEKVSRPKKIAHHSSYFQPAYFGYLAMLIIEVILKDEHINWFASERESGKAFKENVPNIPKQKLSTKFKNKLNYFSGISGIYFIPGLLLSVIYMSRNFAQRRKPNYFTKQPILTLNTEIMQFIKIFRALFSEKTIFKKDYQHSIDKIKKLYIGNSGYLVYGDNVHDRVYKNYFAGKSNFCVYQHGASYGMINYLVSHEIEFNCPSFISWGREVHSNVPRKNIINNLPSPQLYKLKDLYAFNNQKKIIWVTCSIDRCGEGLIFLAASQHMDYVEKKEKLLDFLDKELLKDLIYKPFPTKIDAGHFADEFLNKIPKNQQVLNKINLNTLILSSKFSILDYLGTSFYEAMSMNAPVVLCLFHSTTSILTDSARELLKEFEKLGVMHTDPEKAAVFINSLNTRDVQEWWQDKAIQDLRKQFLEMYANNKPYFWPWLKAILKREI